MPEIVLRHFDPESDWHRAAVQRRREQERAIQDRHAARDDKIERWLDLYPKAVSPRPPASPSTTSTAASLNLRSELDKAERNIARLAEWDATTRSAATHAASASVSSLDRLGGRWLRARAA